MDGAGALLVFPFGPVNSSRNRSQQPVHGILSLKGQGLSGICLGSSDCLLWHTGKGCSKASLKPIRYWLAASLGSYQVLLILKSGLNVIYWGSNLCIYLLVRLCNIELSLFMTLSGGIVWLRMWWAPGQKDCCGWNPCCCVGVFMLQMSSPPTRTVDLWKSQVSGNLCEKRVQMVLVDSAERLFDSYWTLPFIRADVLWKHCLRDWG